jgi:hypothetical protein
MQTGDYDAQISDLESQIESLKVKMEDVCRAFLLATDKFAANWLEDRAERAVTTNPEVTKKIPQERLKKLKSALDRLVLRVPRIVGKHVNKDSHWAHRGQMSDDLLSHFGRYRIYGRSVPDELDNAVREVLGYVGGLLAEYNLADVGEYKEWAIEYPGPHPKYRREYIWSEEMNTALMRYSDLYSKLLRLSQELKEAKNNKEEAEAKGLWDKA